MNAPRLLWISCAVAVVGVPLVSSAELSGRIEVKSGEKQSPATGAVVWIPGVPIAQQGPPASMASKEKRFEPHVLVVSRGATISFPNFDKIHHNVFSRTPGSEFDLGLYRGGTAREFHVTTLGLVRVYCNIHSQMAGYIMVLDGSAFVVTDADGRFRLESLPEGRREVHVWHERAGETNTLVDLGHTPVLNLVLDASGYKETSHKNKYGEDYPPVALDDDRY